MIQEIYGFNDTVVQEMIIMIARKTVPELLLFSLYHTKHLDITKSMYYTHQLLKYFRILEKEVDEGKIKEIITAGKFFKSKDLDLMIQMYESKLQKTYFEIKSFEKEGGEVEIEKPEAEEGEEGGEGDGGEGGREINENQLQERKQLIEENLRLLSKLRKVIVLDQKFIPSSQVIDLLNGLDPLTKQKQLLKERNAEQFAKTVKEYSKK
jgi:hypothetical protein